MNENCCTIRTDFPRPAKELVEKFRGVPVSNLVDAMFGEFSLPSDLHPVNQVPLLGPAFTVQCPPGDNLMFHKSLDMVQPRDIIVIDAGGYTERGIVGELMTSFTRLHGCAGIVVYGAIRDVEPLRKMDFPVYALAASPNTPFQNGPGTINEPIAIGHTVVWPGDIISGDQDGLTVIPPLKAEAILKKALAIDAHEAQVMATMEKDRTWNRPFVEKKLQELHCEYL